MYIDGAYDGGHITPAAAAAAAAVASTPSPPRRRHSFPMPAFCFYCCYRLRIHVQSPIDPRPAGMLTDFEVSLAQQRFDRVAVVWPGNQAYIGISIYICIYIMRLSLYLSVHLAIHLAIHLSLYLSGMCLSVRKVPPHRARKFLGQRSLLCVGSWTEGLR